MPPALLFTLIFIALIVAIAGVDALLDRILGRRLGGEVLSATEWSRRVESIRTRIEAQSLSRLMRGEAPLDKDAELRRRLGVPERS